MGGFEKKERLELNWIGKSAKSMLEPRILLEDRSKSYHAAYRHTKSDCFNNYLIHGDNLLVLKSLESDFSNSIKCIYIDPPYNTGAAFRQYEDGLEHSQWLNLMSSRCLLLQKLLAKEGSFWIQLDDNEVHYCKVMLDEIFGRKNFVTSIVWKRRASQANLAKNIAPIHDYILIYAKDISNLEFNKVPLREEYVNQMYKNPDNDPRGLWRTKPLLQGLKSKNPEWELTAPDGRKIKARWRVSPNTYKRYLADNRIYFPQGGQPNIKIFLEESEGQIPSTFWEGDGTNEEASLEIEALFGDKTEFDTPKPEKLIQKILQIATNEGDLVLDSFGGSGTAAAVAHKMKRRWIMVELGDHCYTHIIPRLKKVIDGEDQGGITKAVDWKGGGGFRFYELAPSLLKKDKWDNYIINPEYNAEMLTEAMCKHLGFKYEPSDSIYWMHGHSTEADFIYVTTQNLTREMLQAISDEVGDERTLLICCKAFRAGKNEFANLTLEKIPNAILKRCEWDKDDYSLQVESLTVKEPEPGTQQGLVFDQE